MPKYVAFLRAVNVGGHIVKMDQLRRLFKSQGFTNVETFIASGNVIFDSPVRSTQKLEKKIEQNLKKNLGYEVETFIRSIAELAEIASYEPFPGGESDGEGCVVYIGFLGNSPAAAARKKLLLLRTPVDEFHLNGREFYWLCRGRMSDSQITGNLLQKTLGMQTTMRNSNTVRRLVTKYPG
ncbi:MAG: DUF1697 domain-containing protein [bacterium]